MNVLKKWILLNNEFMNYSKVQVPVFEVPEGSFLNDGKLLFSPKSEKNLPSLQYYTSNVCWRIKVFLETLWLSVPNAVTDCIIKGLLQNQKTCDLNVDNFDLFISVYFLHSNRSLLQIFSIIVFWKSFIIWFTEKEFCLNWNLG